MRIVQLALVFGLLGFGSRHLPAQEGWGLSLEIGRASFSGHASSIQGFTPETSGHPSSTSTLGFGLDRTGQTVRFSVRLLLASTGVTFENDDAAAEVRNLLDLLEITPQVSVLIFHPREAEVRLHGGVVLDRWSPQGDDARTVLGGLGGISLELPLSTRVRIQVRWEAALTGSVFDEDDLPAEFERDSGMGRRWVLGARYRL